MSGTDTDGFQPCSLKESSLRGLYQEGTQEKGLRSVCVSDLRLWVCTGLLISETYLNHLGLCLYVTAVWKWLLDPHQTRSQGEEREERGCVPVEAIKAIGSGRKTKLQRQRGKAVYLILSSCPNAWKPQRRQAGSACRVPKQ